MEPEAPEEIGNIAYAFPCQKGKTEKNRDWWSDQRSAPGAGYDLAGFGRC